MNATNITEYTNTLGAQAKAASALMARAQAATKNIALRKLASLLRENVQALQVDNAKDIERAVAAGLAAPMVDRLKLTPKVIETCAQGCEQLASMADVIGEIIGMKQQPSGIRVGQMRVPIGVFGMIFESRPNVTIEAPLPPDTNTSCAGAKPLTGAMATQPRVVDDQPRYFSYTLSLPPQSPAQSLRVRLRSPMNIGKATVRVREGCGGPVVAEGDLPYVLGGQDGYIVTTFSAKPSIKYILELVVTPGLIPEISINQL